MFEPTGFFNEKTRQMMADQLRALRELRRKRLIPTPAEREQVEAVTTFERFDPVHFRRVLRVRQAQGISPCTAQFATVR